MTSILNNQLILSDKYTLTKYERKRIYEEYGKCIVIKKRKINKIDSRDIRSIYKSFGLYYYMNYDRNHLIQLDDNTDTLFKLDNSRDYTKENRPIINNTDKYKTVYRYLKFSNEFINSKADNLNSISITDDDIKRIDLEFKMQNKAYLRKINKEIVVRNIHGNRTTIRIKDIAERKLVIYTTSSVDSLKDVKAIIECFKTDKVIKTRIKRLIWLTGRRTQKTIRKVLRQDYTDYMDILYIDVAKSNLKYIEDLDNTLPADSFYRNPKTGGLNKPIMKKIGKLAYYFLLHQDNLTTYDLKKYSKHYSDKVNYYKGKYLHGYRETRYLDNYRDIILKLAEVYKLVDYNEVNKVLKIFKTVKRINKLVSYVGQKHASRILFDSGILKMNPEMYKIKQHCKLKLKTNVYNERKKRSSSKTI